ncbi:hypothetical protein FQR65_LT16280 [Abscondita terminalis]|nr:hypothetical protein FQR65_LT16280 [Abscondita terminalis]
MAKEKKETPLMGQYNSIKAKYPDALLLFRVGDFYETFGQDAVKTSQILGKYMPKTGRLGISPVMHYAYEKLTQHFKTKSLKGFGIDDQKLAIVASGGIFAYLVEDTHHSLLNHITKIQSIPQEDYLMMDAFTLRNLEIVFSSQQKGKSLLDIIDKTSTPMGGRLLRRRLILPLKNINEINRRLSLVEFLNKEEQLKYEISLRLRTISGPDQSIWQLLCTPLTKEHVIKEGVSEELDRLRNLQSKGKGFLDEMRDREIERTGISSLKIDFNNVFGYFIEVRNTHKDKVPEDWIRKQTLVNAERYITEELKEYESQILGAEEKISLLESELYRATCTYLLQYIDLIQENSALIAQLDCALGLSELSVQEQYTKPVLNDSFVISISEGRHPIIEKSLPLGEKYIPNDIYLDQDSQQIIMVTGPNMAGMPSKVCSPRRGNSEDTGGFPRAQSGSSEKIKRVTEENMQLRLLPTG